MDLSVVLWNCNGTKKGEEATKERIETIQRIFNEWKGQKKIPNAVLTQETYTETIYHRWETLFPVTAFLNNKEAGCYFKEHSEVTFVYPKEMIEVIRQTEEITPDIRSVVNRIHCAILTATEEEKILICSWHGPHNPGHKNLQHEKKRTFLNVFLNWLKNGGQLMDAAPLWLEVITIWTNP